MAKRIKRVAFGLVNSRHHRVRCLLYAGKPDWSLLPTIQPSNAESQIAGSDWVRAQEVCERDLDAMALVTLDERCWRRAADIGEASGVQGGGLLSAAGFQFRLGGGRGRPA